MRDSGLIRYVTACTLCLAILGVNFQSVIGVEKKNHTKPNYDTVIFEKEQNEQQKTNNNKTEQQVQSSKPTESQEVSAEAIKGKIITRYISPYNASSSYNGVYLKNSTGEDINIKSLLESNLKFKLKNTNSPQVLIMHTHTTETFMAEDKDYYTEDFKARTTDNSKNMASVGKIISDKLNSVGIVTLHDTTQHDYPNYTGSYGRSAATVKSYLKKYPDIKIVLDLHRDSVSSGENDKVKLVTEINGKKAAQVMLVMGSQTGTVSDYPNWKENFKLALKLQKTFETHYPTLARPIMLNSKKYNQHLTTGSLLLEFGTEANSYEEVYYSAELVANALINLLNGMKE